MFLLYSIDTLLSRYYCDTTLEKSTNTLYANVMVKVRSDIKLPLKEAIKQHAAANKLEDKAPAIMAGRVICHLLGVEQ